MLPATGKGASTQGLLSGLLPVESPKGAREHSLQILALSQPPPTSAGPSAELSLWFQTPCGAPPPPPHQVALAPEFRC